MNVHRPSFKPAMPQRAGRPTARRSRLANFGVLLMLLGLLLQPLLLQPLLRVQAAGLRQTQTPEERAQALLEQLTPEERVGQLFLVTFEGSDVEPDSPINELIADYHVGGVVLRRDNDNFNLDSPLPEQLLNLSRQVQLNRWSASQQNQIEPVTGESFEPTFIPLFVGIAQEGDGYPYDQVLEGLTQLPNQMALGATWNPERTSEVGSVLGKELSALGVNLLFGPSLDVLERLNAGATKDLGTRTFGGDPFWVGEMGQAYIEGVHLGSAGRVAVIATHFPGHGGSDRLPEEEVATVRKSLEQLESFELSPFFAVTGDASSAEATVDALLTSHIRYQGFQGNIRATTRPVSFDPQAFSLLMDLQPIKTWRQSGGVMVSDNLGSRAIRRFYELTNQEFDMPRRVALTAFLAGNDLLFVDDFSSGELDSISSAKATLEFFAQKYREDTAFAQRVDASVLRILTLKFKLYQSFSLGLVLSPPEAIDVVGSSGQVVFDVAREAATLISPSPADLDETAPDPPDINDRIVFITDDRSGQQCSTCDPQPLLDVEALEDVVLRRYGPQAGGQVASNRLSSFSLSDLQELLDGQANGSTLERELENAHWLVFAMLNASDQDPSFDTLNRFLVERPDLFLQKRLIVFAFNAPYFLDATDITKLTAYYGLYSKAPQFVDVAAYLLFRELRPSGALPVSVPGVYDLNTALFPDPQQIIPLALDRPVTEQTNPETSTPSPDEPAPLTEFRIGDVIPVRTGIIVDSNGNPVPDGTPVDFQFSLIPEGSAPRQTVEQAFTSDGIARASYTVNNAGALEVQAQTETAQQSQTLRIDIPSEGGVVIVTEAVLPTASPSPTTTIQPTPAIEAATPETPPIESPALSDWIMSVLVSGAIAWSAYRLVALMGQLRWGIRSGFLALIGGLLAYTYLALQMPGSAGLLNESISRGIFIGTLLGAGLGLIAAWAWHTLTTSAQTPE